jgi:hypothetical protein
MIDVGTVPCPSLFPTSSSSSAYYTYNGLIIATMNPIITRLCTFLITLLATTIGSVKADATFTPILPPSYPLAVRNPYLSGKLFNP